MTKIINGRSMSRRQKIIILLAFSLIVVLGVYIVGRFVITEADYANDFKTKLLAPSSEHPFGTDWLGRDMLARTLRGLSTSLYIAFLAAVVASVLAVVLGIAAATIGGAADSIFNFLVDLGMGMPHLIFQILICFCLGKGYRAVMIAVIVTHWMSLGRLVRAEVLTLKNTDYVKTSESMGKSKWWIATRHLLPHLFPQFVVGLVLLFPHAILHEASITFLGFGLPMEMPAVGVILSESMRYLAAGKWWLAVFPGVCLLVVVLLFDAIGECAKKLLDPYSYQE